MLALLLLLGSCSGTQSTPLAGAHDSPVQTTLIEQSAGFALGSPADLLRITSTEPTPYKLDGDSFSSELPHDGADAHDGKGYFYAKWNRVWEHQIAEPAYAVYHFNLPDYDREPVIEIEWYGIRPDVDIIWFGIANWDRNNWDWFPAPTTPWLEFESLDKYFSDEYSMFIALVTTANCGCCLGSLRVGLDPDLVFTGLWDTGVNPGDCSFEFECIVDLPVSPYLIEIEFLAALPYDPPWPGSGQWFYPANGSPFGFHGIIFDSVSGCSLHEGYYWVRLHVEDGIGDWRSAWWPEPVYIGAETDAAV